MIASVPRLCNLIISAVALSGCGASSASPPADAAVTQCLFDAGRTFDFRVFDLRDGGAFAVGLNGRSGTFCRPDDPAISSMRCGSIPMAHLHEFGFFFAFARPLTTYPPGTVLRLGPDFDLRFYAYLSAVDPTRMYGVELVTKGTPLAGSLTITVGRTLEIGPPGPRTQRLLRLAGHACGETLAFSGEAELIVDPNYQ